MRLRRLVRVYTCQNVKLLEISCCGSYVIILVFIRHSFPVNYEDLRAVIRRCSLPSIYGGHQRYWSRKNWAYNGMA